MIFFDTSKFPIFSLKTLLKKSSLENKISFHLKQSMLCVKTSSSMPFLPTIVCILEYLHWSPCYYTPQRASKYSVFSKYRITAVLKIETDINTSITASPSTDVIVFICNVIMYLTSHWPIIVQITDKR